MMKPSRDILRLDYEEDKTSRECVMTEYYSILDNVRRILQLDEEHSIEVEDTFTPHKKLVIKCHFDGTPQGVMDRLNEVFKENALIKQITEQHKKEIKELKKYKIYYEMQQRLVNGEDAL